MYSLLTKRYRRDKRRPEDGIGVFSAPKVPQGSRPLRHRLCLVSTAFQVAAVADSSWALSDEDLIGLFNECKSDPCDTDWWRASRAFSILGLLTVILSLFLGLVHVVLPDRPIILLLASVSCGVSVLFLVIEGGISLQSRTDRDSTSVTFGVDIVLSVFACGFSFFSALLYLMGRTH
ncbi:uncharacterized protein LOC112562255 [Pomacea canaliculata]|uniref:uncharacterized protein LOC112562255 n=1 Tax=Pomacea canaliculata TaxID=400727 RepID=UPI000D7309F9|nr:uncharacterized protein LOC112562255 [Pomacea canaliculata]